MTNNLEPYFDNVQSYPWCSQPLYIKVVWFIMALCQSKDKSIGQIIRAIKDLETI